MWFSVEKIKASMMLTREIMENAAGAFIQIFYITLPLVILYIVELILGAHDSLDVFQGSEAMFVVVFASIDGSRNAIRHTSLSLKKTEVSRLDDLATISTLVVVAASVLLVLSILIEKNLVPISCHQRELVKTFILALLPGALFYSWWSKFRLNLREANIFNKFRDTLISDMRT